MSTTHLRRLVAVTAAAGVALGVSACSSGESSSGATTENGVTTLELWTHNGGNEAELAINEKMIADFNASQDKYKVELESFPQDSYNAAVTAAASAKELPCILDIDGPNVANWAWAGYLAPLDLPEGTFDNQLESTMGVVDDEVYSFGHYDVALNLTTRKSILEKYDIRIPTIDEPWTKAEFMDALASIKAGGEFDYALDLGTAGSGEWLPYAYSPLLQSFGGDLVDRDDHRSADGVLNGPDALAWAEWLQGVIADKYVAKKSGADSTADFVNGKTAIMWTGSWAANAVTEKYGDDALFLPPVDFGNGPKIGGGSWQWGMSADCGAKEGAQAYLEFSAKPEYFVEYADTLGLIPANTEAAAELPEWSEGGKYHVFFELAQELAVVRPVTPAYPFISSTFAKASQDIIAGGDPKEILDKAAADIDANISSNGNYEF